MFDSPQNCQEVCKTSSNVPNQITLLKLINQDTTVQKPMWGFLKTTSIFDEFAQRYHSIQHTVVVMAIIYSSGRL